MVHGGGHPLSLSCSLPNITQLWYSLIVFWPHFFKNDTPTWILHERDICHTNQLLMVFVFPFSFLNIPSLKMSYSFPFGLKFRIFRGKLPRQPDQRPRNVRRPMDPQATISKIWSALKRRAMWESAGLKRWFFSDDITIIVREKMPFQPTLSPIKKGTISVGNIYI